MLSTSAVTAVPSVGGLHVRDLARLPPPAPAAGSPPAARSARPGMREEDVALVVDLAADDVARRHVLELVRDLRGRQPQRVRHRRHVQRRRGLVGELEEAHLEVVHRLRRRRPVGSRALEVGVDRCCRRRRFDRSAWQCLQRTATFLNLLATSTDKAWCRPLCPPLLLHRPDVSMLQESAPRAGKNSAMMSCGPLVDGVAPATARARHGGHAPSGHHPPRRAGARRRRHRGQPRAVAGADAEGRARRAQGRGARSRRRPRGRAAGAWCARSPSLSRHPLVVTAGVRAKKRLMATLASPAVQHVMPKLGGWLDLPPEQRSFDGPDEQDLAVAPTARLSPTSERRSARTPISSPASRRPRRSCSRPTTRSVALEAVMELAAALELSRREEAPHRGGHRGAPAQRHLRRAARRRRHRRPRRPRPPHAGQARRRPARSSCTTAATAATSSSASSTASARSRAATSNARSPSCSIRKGARPAPGTSGAGLGLMLTLRRRQSARGPRRARAASPRSPPSCTSPDPTARR